MPKPARKADARAISHQREGSPAAADQPQKRDSETGPRGDPHALLRQAGLRVTSVRLGIIQALAAAGAALDAQQVFDRIAGRGATDRVTVYRTLNTLVDSGLAHRVDPGDRVFRYNLTDHGRCEGEHHQHEHAHFVCDDCGRVECLDDAEVTVKPRAQRSPERRFRVRQQDVTLHGTCGLCENAAQPVKAPAPAAVSGIATPGRSPRRPAGRSRRDG